MKLKSPKAAFSKSDERKKVTILNTKETQSDEEKAGVQTFLLSRCFPERKENKAR
ncbi:MAG: hypothetical protein IKX47_04180 [Oscillospiraceae bacterium]|nr:hypothetical protein [Oscillospiraceae bacterium]